MKYGCQRHRAMLCSRMQGGQLAAGLLLNPGTEAKQRNDEMSAPMRVTSVNKPRLSSACCALHSMLRCAGCSHRKNLVKPKLAPVTAHTWAQLNAREPIMQTPIDPHQLHTPWSYHYNTGQTKSLANLLVNTHLRTQHRETVAGDAWGMPPDKTDNLGTCSTAKVI